MGITQWRSSWLLVFSITLVVPTLRVDAESIDDLYLEGLRQRGYYDTAIEYLEAAAADPAVPQAFKESVLYHHGTLLFESSQQQNDLDLRVTELQDAAQLLEKFVAEHADHPLATQADWRLREVVSQRAGIAKAQAERATTDAEKDKYLDAARQLYEDSHQSYSARIDELKKQLSAMQSQSAADRDADLYATLRQEYVVDKFNAALALFEKAQTYGVDSKSKAIYEKASESFQEVSDKYHTKLHGLLALYYLGRCHERLGKPNDALALYDELMALEHPARAIRALRTSATQAAMGIWSGPEKKKPLHAAQLGMQWSAELTPPELEAAFGLEFQLAAAKTCLDATEETDADKERLEAFARRALIQVAKVPSPYQVEAREIINQMNGGQPVPTLDVIEPKTLAEAQAAIETVRTEMANAEWTLRMLKPKLADAQSDDRRQQLQGDITQAEQKLEQCRTLSAKLAQQGMLLASTTTPPETLNELRFMLAYSYYQEKRLHEAAVLGEFVARQYPEFDQALNMAKIAQSAYQQMYAAASEDDRDFEIERLISVSEYIAQAWPSHDYGREAAMLLVKFAVSQGDLQRAMQYAKLLPDEQQGEAQLQIGQLQWNSYLKAKQQQRESDDGDPARPDDESLETLKNAALQTLTRALHEQRQAGKSQSLVEGALVLAQIYVDTNQSAKAIELLEDKEIGPLSLAESNSPLVEESGLAELAYKTALRARIASLPGARNKEATTAAAVKIMESLDRRVGESPEGRSKLVAIYVGLAQDLKKQMELSPPSVQRTLAEGFEVFLNSVAQNATEFNVLNWTAESFAGLGSGLKSSKGQSQNANRYFERAVATYQLVLDQAAKGTLSIDERMQTAVRLRMAIALGEMGEYSKALDIYADVLRETPMILSVQIDAAKVYQEGGIASADFGLLAKAVNGSHPDPQTKEMAVWGWGRISKICMSQFRKGKEQRERFSDSFYEARYNLTVCRYEQAKLKQGADREKYLQLAKRGVVSLARSYPDLGGDVWKSKFEQLLKRVQSDLGEQAVGLAATRKS